MGYKNINYNSKVKDLRFEVFTWGSRIVEKFDQELTVDTLLKGLSAGTFLTENVSDALVYSAGKSVELVFTCEENENRIELVNTTSDVEEENFYIHLESDIVADSVLVGRSLTTEVNDDYLKNGLEYGSVEEFYAMHWGKKTLIYELTGRLAQDKFSIDSFGHRFELDDCGRKNFEKIVNCLEPDNLRNILGNYTELVNACLDDRYVSVLLANASKRGYLKFKPYVKVDKYGNPSLVLKYNRFVHLFRGYGYQCSYTEDGIGEYSSSGIRIDAIRAKFRDKDLGESRLLKYLYYMNLIHCCREIDEFNNLLKNSPQIVDDFMQKSVKGLFDSYDVTYSEFYNVLSCSLDDTCLDQYKVDGVLEPGEIYRIAINDTSDYARVNFYKSELVGIEYWQNDAVQEKFFKLPSPFNSYEQAREIAEDWDEDDVDKFIETVTIGLYDTYEVRCALCAYALNTCGFITNFLVTYPTRDMRESKLRSLNRMNIPEFKNLGILYKSEN